MKRNNKTQNSFGEVSKLPEVKLLTVFVQEVREAYNGNDHPNVILAKSFFNHLSLPEMAMEFVNGGERKNPLKPEKFQLWIQEVKGTECADDEMFAELMESHFLEYEKLFNVFVKKERRAKAERDQFATQSNAIQNAFRSVLKV
jgi:hypothetical protein